MGSVDQGGPGSGTAGSTGAAAPFGKRWRADVLDALPLYVVALDDQLRVVWANRSAHESLRPGSSLIDEGAVELIDPGDLEAVLLAQRLFEVHPELLEPSRYRLLGPDGERVPVDLFGVGPDAVAELGYQVMAAWPIGYAAADSAPLEALASGEPLEVVAAHLHATISRSHTGTACCLLFEGEDGERTRVGAPLPDELLDWLDEIVVADPEGGRAQGWVGVGSPPLDAEVVTCLSELRPIAVEDLPRRAPGLARAAQAEGFGGLAVVPARDPGSDRPAALVGWSTDGLLAERFRLRVSREQLALFSIALRRRDDARRLARAARTDHLTGLANRYALEEAVRAGRHPASQRPPEGRQEPEGGEEVAGDLVVLYIDLDGFKPVNDRFGHRVGDQVLVAVAERLRSCTRAGDLLARLGGDEFALICRSRDDGESTALADRIVEELARPYDREGVGEVRIGASVGIARAREGEPLLALLDRADAAMYEAKGRPMRWRSAPSGESLSG